MKKLILIQIAHLLLLMSCSTATSIRNPSEAPTKDFQDDKIAERVTAAVTPQIGTKNIGAIVAIYNKGSLQFLSFGETTKGNKTPPTPDTLFEIGSITKTFTGLMLARSIELKRVSPTDTLDKFKNEWKNQKAGSINLTELVTHRSGLPRLPCNMHWSNPKQPYEDYSENDLIKGLQDSAFNSDCVLNAHPTLEIDYSNWGMATLCYLLASEQKTTFEKLLHQLILSPLQLNNTTITLSPDQQKRVATGYDIQLYSTPLWERKILDAQGAIKSSARDILKYSQVYLRPESTSFESSIRLAMKPQYETPEDLAIGHAWFVKRGGSIWHNGQTGGFYSLIKIYPRRDLVVLYLTNTSRELKCVLHAVEEVPCDPTAP